MGISLSLLSKMGVPGVGSFSTDKVYDKYFDENIKTFEQFHTAFIDLCKFLNDIIPGKHYDAPTRKEIEEFYNTYWMDHTKTEEEKKDLFIKFMKEKVKESRSDDQAVIIAGVVAPAAAIFVKKTSDNIPQVKRLKLHLIPNFIFVPSCTLFALAGVRFVQINKKSKA